MFLNLGYQKNMFWSPDAWYFILQWSHWKCFQLYSKPPQCWFYSLLSHFLILNCVAICKGINISPATSTSTITSTTTSLTSTTTTAIIESLQRLEEDEQNFTASTNDNKRTWECIHDFKAREIEVKEWSSKVPDNLLKTWSWLAYDLLLTQRLMQNKSDWPKIWLLVKYPKGTLWNTKEPQGTQRILQNPKEP